MRFIVLLFLFISLTTSLFAQSDDWLIKFENGYTVDQSEFEYVYQKNNGGYDKAAKDSKRDYREYLDLFVNYKRKVLEAERLKLDTAQTFKTELNRYLKQLAQPYLIEQTVLKDLIQEAYDRSAYALKVSHILIKLPKNPEPKDTLIAWKRINDLRADIVNGGKDFSDLAKHNSDDPSAKDNAGYLSWFTVFDFIYGFEDAAFETAVGEVSQPVRTDYGYHIIKVHDKREMKAGKPRLSHLLVRAGASYAANSDEEAKARIDSIYQELQDGADFEALVKAYSDDPNSRSRGGDLGTRYMGIPELQDKKFELEPGELSQPFKTKVGWHIVKVSETIPLKSFDEMQPQLKSRVSRDPRAQLAEATLIKQLKQEYNFEINEEAYAAFAKELEQEMVSLLKGDAEFDPAIANQTLFKFDGGQFTNGDLLDYMRNLRSPKMAEYTPKQRVKFALESMEKKQILGYEETQLDRKYDDYRNLKREYRDGILLFTLTEDKVWQKAVKDTVGLEKFWNTHKDEYTAGDRVEVYTYSTKREDALEKLRQLFDEYNHETMAIDSALKADRIPVRTNRQVLEVSESDLAKRLYNEKQQTPTATEQKDGRSYVYLPVKYMKAGTKTFREAKAQAITDYQNYLEKAWLEELTDRYPYTLNDKAFKKLFK